MRPDLDPFVTRVEIAIERVAKSSGRGRVVLLIEKSFARPEFGERIVFLQVQGLGVLLDGIVVAALFGGSFAARDNRAYVEARRSI